MSAFNVLDSAVSDSGTVTSANLFELEKYEVKLQEQQQSANADQRQYSEPTKQETIQALANVQGNVSESVISQEPSIDALAYTEIVDAVLSRLMVVGCRFAGSHATVSDFKLSEGEKKKIAPLVQKTAEKYMLYASVEVQLAIMALAMYGGRFLMIVTDDEKKITTKKKSVAKPKENSEASETASRGRGRPRKN